MDTSEEFPDLSNIPKENFGLHSRNKLALRILLDGQHDQKDTVLALKSEMGSCESYITSVPLSWVAAHTQFARDLPIFRNSRENNNGNITINSTTIAYLQQRAPDFTRQLPMTIYLATRKHHKFPALLLVAYQDWIYNDDSDNWGPDDRALVQSLSVEPLDSGFNYVNLGVEKTNYFALDGQHRLMAIKGLRDLLDGGLYAKDSEGQPYNKKRITLEEIEQIRSQFGLKNQELQKIMDQRIGVEIIPAVQTRDSKLESVARLRNIFVDVNQNAKKLTKGELALLDENDGYSIVARTIMVNHKLFQSQDGIIRVNTKSGVISNRSKYYTTLNSMVNVVENYLSNFSEFDEWKTPILELKNVGKIKPYDEQIESGLKILTKYFDELIHLPSHTAMAMNDVSVSDLRNEEDGNILFRPIAQEALAVAVGKLHAEGNSINNLISLLVKQEKLGKLKLNTKKSPWFGVICNPIDSKIRRHIKYRNLCSRLFLYFLGGKLIEEQYETLRNDLFEARVVGTSKESDIDLAFDFDGNLKEYKNFSLPAPWCVENDS